MTTRKILLLSLLSLSALLKAQQVQAVYKKEDLLKRISGADTAYVVNFWATWCKPCVKELPSFDSLLTEIKDKPLKVLLVSLDFAEDTGSRVNPFLRKNKVRAECVLLDEVNGNDFVNLIHPDWSGSIPATLFRKGSEFWLAEKSLHLKALRENLSKFGK